MLESRTGSSITCHTIWLKSALLGYRASLDWLLAVENRTISAYTPLPYWLVCPLICRRPRYGGRCVSIE
jgi:hypothetical protein